MIEAEKFVDENELALGKKESQRQVGHKIDGSRLVCRRTSAISEGPASAEGKNRNGRAP